jgi:uncharacterized membrane protein
MERYRIATITIIALSILLAIVLYPIAPEMIPTHWNIAGEPDAWSDKGFGLAIIPIILFGSALIFSVMLRYIGPTDLRGRRAAGWFIVCILGILLAIQIYAGMAAVGDPLPAALFFPILFAILYFCISFLLPRISRRNRMIGIRTPWTMKSDDVWRHTHLAGGRVFRIAAGFTLLGALFPGHLFLFIIAPAVGALLWLLLVSYREYQNLGEIG